MVFIRLFFVRLITVNCKVEGMPTEMDTMKAGDTIKSIRSERDLSDVSRGAVPCNR